VSYSAQALVIDPLAGVAVVVVVHHYPSTVHVLINEFFPMPKQQSHTSRDDQNGPWRKKAECTWREFSQTKR
jgi:hypothetical protein